MKFYNSVDIVSKKYSKEDLIRKKILSQNNDDSAFFLSDLGRVVDQHQDWIRLCPAVVPFYAVKCNNDTPLLQTLAALGTGFDCASRAEIEQVLSLGVDPQKIIFANPCKIKSHIEFARERGVSKMTFDDVHEMEKIKSIYPEAELVLRFLPPPTKAVCNLGCKFGVVTERAPELVKKAKDLDMNLMGVSFHVGSGCMEADAFSKAIFEARELFDAAKEVGFNLELLDIGGGFPGHEQGEISFEEMTGFINSSLEKYFSDHIKNGVKVIAEPGRYFASAAYTLVANIIGKRDRMYYINDGVYGSFNCLLYDHAEVEMLSLDHSDQPVYSGSSVWGPTCDGLDCVLESVELPDLNIGDWVVFPNMGAYTLAAGSTFNGMPRPSIYNFMSEEKFDEVREYFTEENTSEPAAEDAPCSVAVEDTNSEGYFKYLQTTSSSFNTDLSTIFTREIY